MVCRAVVALALLLALPAWAAPPATAGPNLVVNGGFEDGTNGWLSSIKAVDEPVYEGKHAAVLDNRATSKDIWAVQTFIPLKPRTDYRVSLALRRTTGQGYVYVHGNWLRAPGERLMISKTWAAPRAVPITSRTGESVGRWQVLSGTIRSESPDTGGIQLVILLKGNDAVYLDDVRVEAQQYPTAKPWRLLEDVVFPGSPSAMGMRVEQAVIEPYGVAVTTTGAEFLLDAGAGVLIARQRLGGPRDLFRVRFAQPFVEPRIRRQSPDVCVVTARDVAFGFQGDSLVTIATNQPLDFTVTSAIGARWLRRSDPHLLAIDERGGFSVMTYARPAQRTDGSTLDMPEQPTTAPGWTARWHVAARELAALAAFPGRPVDRATSFRKRIVNTADCPTPEALRGFAQHANVLFLFGKIYRDKPEGSEHAPYQIKDPAQLKATIALAHQLGMQVIAYRHPASYAWAGMSLDEGLADMARCRREYGFDGWYLDGYPAWQSWYDSYRAIRTIRAEIGRGILYTHCTINPPAGTTELYCPFLDTWSDFLLRGEGQRIDGPADPYLRYVVGTEHISNSLATLKGDAMRAAAGSEEKASLRLQLETMLKLNGRCRWAYPQWPFGRADREDYLGYYFPALDRQQQAWEQTGQPPAMTWP